MASRISRRKLAEYAAEKLVSSKPGDIMKELAAFLIETKRTRELELLVRDIESALAMRGVVIANVVTARPLTDELRMQIKQLTGGKTLKLRETVDESVLGGMRLTLPDRQLDATLRRKIQSIKA